MVDNLGWLALMATSLAAIMTAANLGAKVTGVGFAIFFIGALAWCAVGAFTDQRQLLWSNAFLAIVDLIGAWRWLYRRAQAEDAIGKSKSRYRRVGSELFSFEDMIGMTVRTRDGVVLGIAEGALADKSNGEARFVLVRAADKDTATSGFRQLPWSRVSIEDDRLIVDLTHAQFQKLQAV